MHASSRKEFWAESEAAIERQIQMIAWLPYIANKSAPHILILSIRYGKFLALLYGPHKRDDEVHNLLIVVQPSFTKVCLSRMSINALGDLFMSLCNLRVQCGTNTFTLTQFLYSPCVLSFPQSRIDRMHLSVSTLTPRLHSISSFCSRFIPISSNVYLTVTSKALHRPLSESQCRTRREFKGIVQTPARLRNTRSSQTVREGGSFYLLPSLACSRG